MKFPSKAIANFFFDTATARGDTSLSPMKLQKFVYFAHGWHLGITGQPLILEQVQAWPYGPVIKVLYHEFKHFGNGQILTPATDALWNPSASMEVELVAPRVPVDGSPESTYTYALLNRIWELYNPFTAIQLSNETHKTDSPWDQVKSKYPSGIPMDTEIPNDLIRDYFARLAGRPKPAQ